MGWLTLPDGSRIFRTRMGRTNFDLSGPLPPSLQDERRALQRERFRFAFRTWWNRRIADAMALLADAERQRERQEQLDFERDFEEVPDQCCSEFSDRFIRL